MLGREKGGQGRVGKTEKSVGADRGSPAMQEFEGKLSCRGGRAEEQSRVDTFCLRFSV